MFKDWGFDNIEASGDTFSRRSKRQHSVPSTAFNRDSSLTPSGRPTRQPGQVDYNEANMSNSIFGNHGIAPDNSDRSYSILGDDVARRSGDVQSGSNRSGTPPHGTVALKQPRSSHPETEAGADDESRKRKAVEQNEDQVAKKQKHAVGGDAGQVEEREDHTAEKQPQTSNSGQVQDRGEVIFVADGNRGQSGQPQQQTDGSGERPSKAQQSTAGTEKNEKTTYSKAEYEAKRTEFNDILRKDRAELKRSTEKNQRFESELDELKLKQVKLQEKLKRLKESAPETDQAILAKLQTWKRREIDEEMAEIRKQNDKDIQKQQLKHEKEVQKMQQKMAEAKTKVEKEKKQLKLDQAEAARKLKESKPEANRLVKEKDQQLKEKQHAIGNLQAMVQQRDGDVRGLKADNHRLRDERDKAREGFKDSAVKRELVEDRNVDLKIQLKRQEQEIEHARKQASLHYTNNNQSAQRAATNMQTTKALSQLNDKNISVISNLERDLRAARAEVRQYKAMFDSTVQAAPTAAPSASTIGTPAAQNLVGPSHSQQGQQSHGMPSLPTVNDSLTEMPVPRVPQNCPPTNSTAPATQNSTPSYIPENHDSRPAAGVRFDTTNVNSQVEMGAVSQNNQDMAIGEPGANHVQTESMMTDEV